MLGSGNPGPTNVLLPPGELLLPPAFVFVFVFELVFADALLPV